MLMSTSFCESISSAVVERGSVCVRILDLTGWEMIGAKQNDVGRTRMRIKNCLRDSFKILRETMLKCFVLFATKINIMSSFEEEEGVLHQVDDGSSN